MIILFLGGITMQENQLQFIYTAHGLNQNYFFSLNSGSTTEFGSQIVDFKTCNSSHVP